LCADACGIGPLLSFILFFWGDFGKPADTFVPQFFVKKIKKKKRIPCALGLWSGGYSLLSWQWLFFCLFPKTKNKTALILLGCF
jgi:hypothetical protein